jgi:fatty-acyl-CoA synthase
MQNRTFEIKLDFNAGELLTKRAESDPDKTALVFEGLSFTYRDLNEHSNRWANAFVDLGVQKGDRVGFLLMNCNEFLEAFFGLAKIGAVAVMLNWRLAVPELEYVCNNSGLSYLIYGEDSLQSVDALRLSLGLKEYVGVGKSQVPSWSKDLAFIGQYPPEEPKKGARGDDRLIILYTSGTTGRPKGVVYTHNTVFWYCVTTLVSFDIRPEDRMLVISPLFHQVGLLCGAVANVYRGCTTLLVKRFDPLKTLQLIEREKAAGLIGVPTFLQRFTLTPDFERYLRSVRWFSVGGAPLPVPLLQTYQQRGVRVGQLFGSAETGYGALISPEKAIEKPASTGLACLNHEIRVVSDKGVDAQPDEVGELIIKSPSGMKEYWNNPQATSETVKDGWIYTGDLARLDEDGYLYIVDRKKDMIISGGENIYPAEIENVLAAHPKILEVAVIGQPDEEWGESPCAIVYAKPGESLTLREVVDFCQGRLGRYKIPKQVITTDQPLPRNPSGKVLKRVLREQMKTELS